MAALAACSTPREPSVYRTPWALTGKETVTVFSRGTGQATRFVQPISGAGAGAAAGAGAGMAGAVDATMGCSDALCLILLPVFLVGGGVVGGAVGAAKSHSESETLAATEALKAAILEARPWDDVAAYLVGQGRVGPAGPSLRQGSGGRVPLVLQSELGFLMQGERYDPDVVTLLRVTGTLKRGPSGTPVSVSWTHTSPAIDYFDLAEDDAALLRKVIRAAAADVAGQIRDELALAVSQATGQGAE